MTQLSLPWPKVPRRNSAATQAKRIRANAEQCTFPIIKAEMLTVAGQYDWIATQYDTFLHRAKVKAVADGGTRQGAHGGN